MLDEQMKRATQLAHAAWPDDKPGQALRDALFAHLLEECGELYGAARDYDGRSLRPDKPRGSLLAIQDELGDVFVILLRIADSYSLQPSTAIDAALNKFARRLLVKAAAEAKP